MTRNPFSAYHPLVAFAFLAIAIAFTMIAFHPVYVALSAGGALVASAVHDGVLLAFIAALACVNAFLAAVACSQFGFYPHMDTLIVWWGYAPYAALMLVPAFLVGRERLLWR